MTPNPDLPTANLTIHFCGVTFKPLHEDLIELARLRSTIPHEVAFTDARMGMAFTDGTVLEFTGRLDKAREHFHCAPWMLGRDPETRRPKIYSAGSPV